MQLNAKAIAKIEAAPRPTAAEILHTRTVIANSGRRGGDLRGNSRDRRVRTIKLLQEFGDGNTCPCVYCGAMLTDATLTQDKIVPGTDGGRYVMANLLPACITCNQRALRRSHPRVHRRGACGDHARDVAASHRVGWIT